MNLREARLHGKTNAKQRRPFSVSSFDVAGPGKPPPSTQRVG